MVALFTAVFGAPVMPVGVPSLEAQRKGCVLLGAVQQGSGDELIMQHKKVSLGAAVPKAVFCSNCYL